MLVTMNNLKYTACHGSFVSQITSWKILHSKLYLVCPMKLDWYWSHVFLVTVYKSYIKNYWKSLQNQWGEIEGKKRMAITKAFVLHSSTKLKHLLTIILEIFHRLFVKRCYKSVQYKDFTCLLSFNNSTTIPYKRVLKFSAKKRRRKKEKKTSLVQLVQLFTIWYKLV